jgi:hypothetical protein
MMYLTAEHTPILSRIKKGSKPRNTLVEYPFKSRFAATENAVVDGTDVVSGDLKNNSANKGMLSSRTQQLREAVGVTKRAQLAGVEYTTADLYADSLMDMMIKMKEDAELMIIRDQNSVAGSDSVAEKTRGLLNWIRTANPGANNDLPVPTAALCASGQIVASKAAASDVTEDDFRGVLQAIATLSRTAGRKVTAYLSPAMKTAFSNFTRTGSTASNTLPLRRFDQQPGKLSLNVTIYDGDFGTVMLVPHFALPSGIHALLISEDEYCLRPLQNFQHTKLPFEGGSYKGFIDAFFALQVDNPQAFGKITT